MFVYRTSWSFIISLRKWKVLIMPPPNIGLVLNRTFNLLIIIALLLISNLYLYFGDRKVKSSLVSENRSSSEGFYNEQNILNLFLKNLKQTGNLTE